MRHRLERANRQRRTSLGPDWCPAKQTFSLPHTPCAVDPRMPRAVKPAARTGAAPATASAPPNNLGPHGVCSSGRATAISTRTSAPEPAASGSTTPVGITVRAMTTSDPGRFLLICWRRWTRYRLSEKIPTCGGSAEKRRGADIQTPSGKWRAQPSLSQVRPPGSIVSRGAQRDECSSDKSQPRQ